MSFRLPTFKLPSLLRKGPPAPPPPPPPPPGPTDAQWKALFERYEAAKKRLEYLEKEDDKPQFWNKAYVVNVEGLPTTVSDTTTVTGFASGSVTVDEGSVFFFKGISCTYTVTGTLTDDSRASITLGPLMRYLMFQFNWMMRDSGTEREVGNLPLPSSALASANVRGGWLDGHGRVRGGSVITFDVMPYMFNNTQSILEQIGLATFESHFLQFVVHGIAVRNDVLGSQVAGRVL